MLFIKYKSSDYFWTRVNTPPGFTIHMHTIYSTLSNWSTHSICIYSNIWFTAPWSIPHCAAKTSNECEGWHGRLNAKIRLHHLPFTQLVQVLHRDTQVVEIQVQFMAHDKLRVPAQIWKGPDISCLEQFYTWPITIKGQPITNMQGSAKVISHLTN